MAANLGFEDKLWEAADKLRNNMDPSDYKHIVLGLIFLKYISDSFEEKYNELLDDPYGDEEDKDEYLAENIFWVPKEARWSYIKSNAKKPEIGQIIDEAMVSIEKENKRLKGILNKSYGKSSLNKRKLGELIDIFSSINLKNDKSKDNDKKEKKSADILGRVYEYFLSKFAQNFGGEYYTPESIVKLLVEMIEPYKGRIYDPCCGSGGMFVQSEKFVEEHQGKLDDLSIYGQESNATTWQLANANLAIRGLDYNLGGKHADSFTNDLHKDLKADYILANPPFNVSDWSGEQLKDDVRWKYGVPYAGNANYAWIQHFIHHLAPNGTAGFVLANGASSTMQSNESEIRKNLVENDLVDCIVAMPTKLFYTVSISVTLWFMTRNKAKSSERTRNNEVLFIDARDMGHLETRAHREFSEEDINEISETYHAWKDTNKEKEYEDIKGFCKSASLEDIKEHEYVLTPGRYVGIKEKETDDEPFDHKMGRLTDELAEQFAKSRHLEEEIRKNLGDIGYEF